MSSSSWRFLLANKTLSHSIYKPLNSLQIPHRHFCSIFYKSQQNKSTQLHNNQHRKSFCSKPSANDDTDMTRTSTMQKENENEQKSEEEEVKEEEDESEWEYREYDNEQLKQKNYQILTWKTVIGTIIVFGIGTIFFQQRIHRHRQKQKQPQYASFGEAQIGGGEWKMTDMHNTEIDQSTLLGKYQIVYFGFVFCPDVCPRELTKMAHAMQLLEERGFQIGEDILPIFVSVDPKRDTPELIKKYVRQFHPQIYGLTGSPQQVAKFAKAYKAYFSTPGPGENAEDYIIDHVTMMYVMGRQGEYIGHISTLENSDEMANKIASMIKDVGHSGGFLGTWFKDPSKLIKQGQT